MAANPEPRPARRRRVSVGAIRVRTTLAAVAVVGLSLVLAGIALVVLVERSLRADVRATALNRAETIATDLASAEGPAGIAAGDEEEEFVQVLSTSGSVLLASPNLSGHPVVVRVPPGRTATVDELPFEEGQFLAVSVASRSSGQPVVVVVGRDVQDVNDAVRTVAGFLVVGVPVLVLLVAIVTWRVVTRALAPVESIRAEVDAISSAQLHRRVPDPPGRDEIARLASTMNRMLERLEQGQRRQRRFVSDASHELRSPVAAIRQHAEVARAHPAETDLDELARVVVEEGIRLQRIVEDLLLLARIDEGTLPLRNAPVDLDDLMFEEAARLRSSTDLNIDVTGVSAGRVLGDRARLERMVRNLTDNAARHARGTLALTLGRDDGQVVLSVEDDGAGIDTAQREHVFDRFVRLDAARDRDSGGSGLGLAIVREIATLHRATVTVRDSALGGAMLEARFPPLQE